MGLVIWDLGRKMSDFLFGISNLGLGIWGENFGMTNDGVCG